MPQKWVIAANGDPTNEPPWGSTLKIETGAENIIRTPLTWGQEISFAPQMIFLDLRPVGWTKKWLPKDLINKKNATQETRPTE